MRGPTTAAVVIGAGFGGIAAALRLGARGYDVTLVDRLDQLGGRGTVYRRNGFVFDAGPTVITAPFLVEELFQLFNRRMEDYLSMVPLDPWYRIRFDDGKVFDYGEGIERTEAEIRKFNPADVAGYREFLRQTERVFDVGFTQLGDVPFHDPMKMLKIVPTMIGLGSYRSVYGYVSKYIKDPYLRQVFSFQPLLVGGNPFTTTSIYALIHYLERKWGIHFAMGGTGSIIAALGRLLGEVGVAVRLGTTADQIEISAGRVTGVRLTGGERLPAGVVVANADAPYVYRQMIAPEYRRKWHDRKIDRLKYSMGLFVMYFGTRKKFSGLAHHMILLGPRYKALLREIFDGKEMPRDFSLYLHVPTVTDPSMAPHGCDAFYVLAPVPNLRSNIDWSVEGDRLRNRIVDYLDGTVLPGLKETIVEDFYVTPEHFRDNLLSLHGSGFSIQPVLTQSAYFRFHNRSEDVQGLYLVGAGTHPGAGMPGVLTSAKVLDRLIPAVAPNPLTGVVMPV
ncbi:MAG: phytoene desaturase [Gemmatimonadota bacterium]|nr:phytoene desaturase [Gemmatimonadota bacterium]